MEVSPQEEMTDPARHEMFAFKRHGLLVNFIYFRTLCEVQSSPLVFTPNRAFNCSPPQGQAPGVTLCFTFAFS